MPAAERDITLEEGAVFHEVRTIKVRTPDPLYPDDRTKDTEAPMDLTGYTGENPIKTSANATVATISVSINVATSELTREFTIAQIAALIAAGHTKGLHQSLTIYKTKGTDGIRLEHGSVTVSKE